MVLFAYENCTIVYKLQINKSRILTKINTVIFIKHYSYKFYFNGAIATLSRANNDIDATSVC